MANNTSTLTLPQIIRKIWYRLAKGASEQEAGLFNFEIESWISESLKRLGYQISNSVRHKLLMKTYPTIAIATGGIVNLNDSTNFPDVLIETIPSRGTVLVSTSTYPAQFVRHFNDLYLPHSNTGLNYWTIQSNAIYLVDSTGAALGTSPTVTVHACFLPKFDFAVPANTTLPVQLEDEFLEMATNIGREKMSPEMAGAIMAAKDTPVPTDSELTK